MILSSLFRIFWTSSRLNFDLLLKLKLKLNWNVFCRYVSQVWLTVSQWNWSVECLSTSGWPDYFNKKAPNFQKMPKMAPNLVFSTGFYLILVLLESKTGSHYLQWSSRLTESDQILLKKFCAQGLKKCLNGEKAPNLVTLFTTDRSWRFYNVLRPSKAYPWSARVEGVCN